LKKNDNGEATQQIQTPDLEIVKAPGVR